MKRPKSRRHSGFRDIRDGPDNFDGLGACSDVRCVARFRAADGTPGAPRVARLKVRDGPVSLRL